MIVRAQRGEWTHIRDDSFLVVALTRRQNGLWPLPTCEQELATIYARPGTPEFEARKAGSFGNDSITVTYRALCALSTALGSRPPFVNDVLSELPSHRASDGGYGTVSERKDSRRTIVSTARHTAMAILLRLAFDDSSTLHGLVADLESSCSWLLKYTLPKGGWAYERSQPEAGLGIESTAASIAALCQYGRAVAQLTESTSAVPRLDYRPIVRQAYCALLGQENNGAWHAANDGIPEDREFVDTAYSIELLCDADKDGALTEIVGSSFPSPLDIVNRYVSWVREGGWPNSSRDQLVSVCATVSALHLLSHTRTLPHPEYAPRVLKSEKVLLDVWKRGSLGHLFRMWDWTSFLALAARNAGPIDEERSRDLLHTASRLRNAWHKEQLRPGSFCKLPKQVRSPIKYALTRGGRERLKSGVFSFVRDVVNGVDRAFLVAIVVALLLAGAYALVKWLLGIL